MQKLIMSSKQRKFAVVLVCGEVTPLPAQLTWPGELLLLSQC